MDSLLAQTTAPLHPPEKQSTPTPTQERLLSPRGAAEGSTEGALRGRRHHLKNSKKNSEFSHDWPIYQRPPDLLL